MQLSNLSRRRLIGAAALACAAALIPAGASAATISSAAPAGAGHPATVPAGFRPSSASFYSPAAGVVLGGVGCLPGKPCQARLVATTDSGAHWSSVKAPNAPVTVVMFASSRNGWLYGGRGLWATHDRGAHWRKLSLARGFIDSMAASAGTAYAVVSPPGGKPDELFASPAGSNAWTRVRYVTGSALAVDGRSAWLVGGTSLWATADGAHWHKSPFACPPGYTAKDGGGLASIAAASPSDVFFLCLADAAGGQQGKAVLRSVNGGRTTHLAGTPPVSGPGGVIALPPRRPRVITLASEFFLDRSGDGGKTWTAKAADGGGAPWNYLSYLSRTAGWAEYGSAPYGWLLRTTNAGVTWHQVSFARPARPVTAYVILNSADRGTVTPINTVTNKAGKPIHLKDRHPYFGYVIAVTPNGKTVYAAAGSVSPISTATNKAGKPINAGIGPGGIVFTPDSKKAYVLDAGIEDTVTDTVTPVNTVTNTAGKPINVGIYPASIAITANGTTVYVSSSRGIVPINTATNKTGKAIKGLTGPIVITPNGKTAYVSNSRGIVPINTATNTAGTTIKLPGSGAIAVTPNGKTLYVVSSRGIVPINTATNTAGKPIKVADGLFALTPNGKTLYDASDPGRVTTVTPISTATNKAGKPFKINTGFFLWDIAFTPNSKTLYLVINGSGTVIPINTATNKAGKAIKVGQSPTAIAITP